ncbi:MAG: TetR/AcrR family transcriptional regulator [Myxococcaceae bacterium]|nr:TetR/AcrR family transcriptional regulator [Myxococcaceae bacterium]
MARTNGKTAGTGEPSAREAERRRTILRAAIEVFARKGYHGCRIADVAKEAGVAYGLVYHYFQNKDELLSSVFDTAWKGFVGRLEGVATGDAPLAEKIRGVARVAFEAYRHDPRAVRVLILEIARSPAGAKVDRGGAFVDIIRLAESMFRQAQVRGELRADLDARLAAAMMFGAIEMGLTSFVVGLFDPKDEAALERVQRQIAEVFLTGVLSPAAAAAHAGASAGSEVAWKKSTSTTKSPAPRRA